MEEEDESRGKTEESGEDRGDGPPDRDPALSPSAFILVRKLGAVRPGGLGSHALKYGLGVQALNQAFRKNWGSLWTLAAGCLECAFQTAEVREVLALIFVFSPFAAGHSAGCGKLPSGRPA
jgi:hypothetical protein